MILVDLFRGLFAPKPPRISAVDAAAHLAGGAVLVDVRSRAEFDRKHIEGALNLPLGSLPESLPADVKTIVVYCASGRRSRMAIAKLGEQIACFDLGPMSAWTNA